MKLVWDAVGTRLYETGDDHAVLYPQKSDGTYDKGVAWNGITAITQSPSGAESTPLYADNIKYVDLRSAEDFGMTIEAYTYPDEWAECDGSKEVAPGVYAGQQSRRSFGFSYRSLLGNDTELDNHGYKLHLIYNGTAAPSQKSYQTVNDSPSAITFSWEVKTTPIAIEGYKPTAELSIDSTKVDAAKLAQLEELLYGTDSEDASLPTPDQVVKIFAGNGAVTPTPTPGDDTTGDDTTGDDANGEG